MKMVVAKPALMLATQVNRMDFEMAPWDQVDHVVHVVHVDSVVHVVHVDSVVQVDLVEDSEPEEEGKDPSMDFAKEINLDRKDVQAITTKTMEGKSPGLY